MEEFKNFKAKINEAESTNLNSTIINPKKLSYESVSILNSRLVDEYGAYFFYCNAANWCKNMNYKKAAAFFEGESNGELEHAKGIQSYLISWNLIPEMSFNSSTLGFSSLVDVINQAYNIEYELLQKYSANQQDLINTDRSTFNFIQHYVDIQVKEVEEYSDYLNALNLIDSTSKFELLYFEQTYF